VNETSELNDSARAPSPAAWMSSLTRCAAAAPFLLLLAAAIAWALIFAHLSLLRHASGGTNAQDLGFTDQVLWNTLQGQWFRMSLYEGATAWNTEMAVSSIARPDSLLAFHFEPLLLLLVPIYAVGGDARYLLILQSVIFALGVIPAFRLGMRWSHSSWVGAAVGATYLLSPLGQSAMLADFHTTALAAPLLLAAIERAAARQPFPALVAAGLAVCAREDAALAVAAAGAFLFLVGHRRSGLAVGGVGALGAALSLAVIASHSGGAWAFAPRYAHLQGGLAAVASSLGRPEVVEFVATVLLSGGLLGMLTPLSVVPIIPVMATNALSTSEWMATGRAHYSVLILPLVVASAAWAVGRLRGLRAPRPGRAVGAAASALVVGAALAHVGVGVGPLSANYAPSAVTEHAQVAANMAERIPGDAAVSASTSLVPRVSRRSSVYLFPTVGTADYVFVDVAADSAPTSAGDAYFRLEALMAQGGWRVEQAEDGILLLARRPGTPAFRPGDLPFHFYSFARGPGQAPSASTEPWSWLVPAPALAHVAQSPTRFVESNLELVGGEIIRATADTLGVDGPRGVLRSTWRATGPVPSGTWVELELELVGGRRMRISDIAAAWWYPPERWSPGEIFRLEVAVPFRGLAGWSARVRSAESG
jgi:uncharacterized membrane protein